MASSYKETLQLTDSLEVAKQKVQEALMKAGFKMNKWVEQQQAFYSDSSVTIWSWGEDIVVNFQENEEGVLIQFKSSCKLSTQIIDWGKNKKNTKKFFSFLNES